MRLKVENKGLPEEALRLKVENKGLPEEALRRGRLKVEEASGKLSRGRQGD